MSRPADDGRHLLKMFEGLEGAMKAARERAERADLREIMCGDAVYAGHCRAIVAYLEGYRDGGGK